MTQQQDNSFFIRPGQEADDPMSGVFTLEGIEAMLCLYPDGRVLVHKRGKDGKPHVRAIAKGQLQLNRFGGENAPDLTGSVATSRGTEFSLVAWAHDVDSDAPYYVLRYDTRPRRKGKFFTPESIAA